MTGTANAGTATISSIQATSTSINRNLTTTITFTGSAGQYSWTAIDSTGAVPPASGTGVWATGQAIALNNWSLQLSGVPASGDTLTVSPTLYPARNNGNANALAALTDGLVVGQSVQANGSVSGGSSVSDAYANLLANLGVSVQSAKVSADLSSSLADQAKAAQTSDSGVNLDEEAAKLIQFQQSYQAAAKMLQVAQTIFDQLLQTTSH